MENEKEYLEILVTGVIKDIKAAVISLREQGIQCGMPDSVSFEVSLPSCDLSFEIPVAYIDSASL